MGDNNGHWDRVKSIALGMGGWSGCGIWINFRGFREFKRIVYYGGMDR